MATNITLTGLRNEGDRRHEAAKAAKARAAAKTAAAEEAAAQKALNGMIGALADAVRRAEGNPAVAELMGAAQRFLEADGQVDTSTLALEALAEANAKAEAAEAARAEQAKVASNLQTHLDTEKTDHDRTRSTAVATSEQLNEAQRTLRVVSAKVASLPRIDTEKRAKMSRSTVLVPVGTAARTNTVREEMRVLLGLDISLAQSEEDSDETRVDNPVVPGLE